LLYGFTGISSSCSNSSSISNSFSGSSFDSFSNSFSGSSSDSFLSSALCKALTLLNLFIYLLISNELLLFVIKAGSISKASSYDSSFSLLIYSSSNWGGSISSKSSSSINASESLILLVTSDASITSTSSFTSFSSPECFLDISVITSFSSLFEEFFISFLNELFSSEESEVFSQVSMACLSLFILSFFSILIEILIE